MLPRLIWTSLVSPRSNFWPTQTSLLFHIVGGPDRPPSKRVIEQMRAEEHAQRTLGRQNTGGSSASRQQAAGQGEGYWAYMQRQIQERTENLGLAGDSMDKLEDNSQGWANDVNKFVKDQKKAAVKGCKSIHQSHGPGLFLHILLQILISYSDYEQAWLLEQST